MNTNLRGVSTRQRIMDVAQDAILSKGFDATSIEEIVAAVEITKGGFFYHFSDKNALARALLERYIAEDFRMLDDVFGRARDLSEDPLQEMLIGLKLLAELMENLPGGHPGCIVASICYQDRLFDADVRSLNTGFILNWRKRFRAAFEQIAAIYPLRDDVSMSDLSDMAMGVVEGGIILGRALHDPKALSRQTLLFRSYVKLLFNRPATLI